MGLFPGQKWCIFGNPGNTLSGQHLGVRNPSICSQGMPCQVLWSRMLGLGRGGQQQLPKKHQALVSPSEYRLFQQTSWQLWTRQTYTLLVCFRSSAKQTWPQTVQRLVPDCKSHFPLPKGGLKPDLHPRPPDLHQNVPQIIANTFGKLMVPGRSLWKSTFW